MFDKLGGAPINLQDLSNDEIKTWLTTFDAVLTDCDGVLWHEESCIPNVPEVLNKLQDEFGKLVIFVTNNGTKTRHENWQRANRLGYKIDEETQLIAPSFTIAQYLKLNYEEVFRTKKVYVIGMESIGKELEEFGIQHFGAGPDIVESAGAIMDEIEQMTSDFADVGAVVIAFDEHFSYGKILKATNYLTSMYNDCLFITTNSDPVQKYPNFHIPGTGAILAAVETSAGRRALQLGKPNPIICDHLIITGRIRPSRTLMIGDSCITDVKFGKNCGFKTLLVGTGQDQLETTVSKMLKNPSQNADFIPDFYLPSLANLLEYL